MYLPPGYAPPPATTRCCTCCTGNDQSDTAFLQIGLQAQLDQLIAKHAIPPLIAVMIQGGPGSNNWRNTGRRRYESYVLEVQQLIDRMLPTVPARDARAIAGDSMGGYGAMNVALAPTPTASASSRAGSASSTAWKAGCTPTGRSSRVSACTRSSTAANRTTSPTPRGSAVRVGAARCGRRRPPPRSIPADTACRRSRPTSNTCSSSPATR